MPTYTVIRPFTYGGTDYAFGDTIDLSTASSNVIIGLLRGDWVDAGGAAAPEVSNALTISTNPTATAYTLALADAYAYLRFTDAGALTVTVPTNAAVAFEIGTVIEVYAAGAGGVTIAGDTGVTVNGAGALSQYGAASLTKVGADEWDATGALA